LLRLPTHLPCGALGVNPQQHCRIVTAARRHHMHRHARIQQARLMTAPQIVHPHAPEAEFRRLPYYLFRGIAWVAWLHERERLALLRQGREHQGDIRQLDQGKVDLPCPIRDPRGNALVLLPHRDEDRDQIIVDR